MNQREKFGLRLKEAREKKGLSQRDLSNIMDDGLNQSQLSKYESGESIPRPERMKKFCEVLEVNEAWLRALYSDEEDDFRPQGEEFPSLARYERGELEALHAKFQELQRSELSWQRKELESQRRILELDKELLDKELMVCQLLEKLTMQTQGVHSLLATLTAKQRMSFLKAKTSLLVGFAELTDPKARLAGLTDRLRDALDGVEELFKEIEAPSPED